MISGCVSIVLAIFIHLEQSSAQSTSFPCNTTISCGCSRSDANADGRIVGGEMAPSHTWERAVSLRDPLGDHICGGSILSRNYVPTAAHCTENMVLTPAFLSIMVGADVLNRAEGQTNLVVKHSHSS